MGRRAFGTGSKWKEQRLGYEVWVGQVRVGRRQRQKVLGRVRDKSGEGLRAQEAEKAMRAWRTELEELASADAVEVPRDRARLSVVGEHHCSELLMLGAISEETARDYRTYLSTHLVPFFDDSPVFEITVKDVEALRDHQLTKGSLRQEGKGLTAQTVRTHVQLLGAIFNRAMRMGLVAANPVSAVELPRARSVEKDIRFLTVEEVHAVVRAARDVEDRLRGETDATIILTAAMTGLRRGELIALRWRDVDWAARQIRVRKNRRRGRTKDPKSERSKRSIPMATQVAAGLDVHFKRSRWQEEYDLVFPHPHTGEHYDPDTLTDRYKKARDRAGVPRVVFHELRHSFGTRMAAAGVPMRTLMEWMGHADMKTTLIYSHYAPAEQEADMIDKAFGATAALPVLTADLAAIA